MMELLQWGKGADARFYLDGWMEALAGVELVYSPSGMLEHAVLKRDGLETMLPEGRARELLAAASIDRAGKYYLEMDMDAWRRVLGPEGLGKLADELADTMRGLLNSQEHFRPCPDPGAGREHGTDVLQLRGYNESRWDLVGVWPLEELEEAQRLAKANTAHFGGDVADMVVKAPYFEGDWQWAPGPVVPTLFILQQPDSEEPGGWETLGRAGSMAALAELYATELSFPTTRIVVRSYPGFPEGEYPGVML